MPARKLGATSAFIWNAKASRYIRRSTGQFVARATIRNALERALRRGKAEMRALSLQLQRGQITLAAWQLGMADNLRATHTYAAAIARGGLAQLTPADERRIARLVRDRLLFLNRFAAELEQGRALDGRFLQRAGMYIDASRTAFQQAQRIEMQEQGMTEERRVRNAAESCSGCIEVEALGYVPIGDLPDIGEQECLTSCQCDDEYR